MLWGARQPQQLDPLNEVIGWTLNNGAGRD
jgi:hypothetical protein